MPGQKNWAAAIASMYRRFGGNRDGFKEADRGLTNNISWLWRNNANTANLEAMKYDADDSLIIGDEAILPQKKTVTFALQNNASLGSQRFFIADKAYRITGISYVHKTAGTNGSAVSCQVFREPAGVGTANAIALQTAVFNCKGTVNVVQNATLVATPGNDTSNQLLLNANDDLLLVFSGTLTTLAGVVVTVYMTPAAKGETAVYYVNANADMSTQTFFIANRDMTITSARLMWSTAFVAAATIDITKDVSTNAPGAGTSILAATVASDGAANTVNVPALTATAATLKMAAGDRLAISYSATTTGVGVVLVISFAPTYGRKSVDWQLGPNAQQQISQCFWIADRDYEVIEMSETHATAAGGAATIKITIDKGTTVPGGGADIAGGTLSFNLNATANTVQFGDSTGASLIATPKRIRLLSAGDRLGINIASGAAQALANVAVTASLVPR